MTTLVRGSHVTLIIFNETNKKITYERYERLLFKNMFFGAVTSRLISI